jgi:hypothetical protein
MQKSLRFWILCIPSINITDLSTFDPREWSHTLNHLIDRFNNKNLKYTYRHGADDMFVLQQRYDTSIQEYQRAKFVAWRY